MRILVTGANGFIGKAVCANAIRAGHVVYALGSNEKSTVPCDTYIQCNLGDLEHLNCVLEGKQIDCCIHLAWVGIPDYSYNNSLNSMINSFNLLEACYAAGINRFVFAGSCFEYLNPDGRISEEWPVKNTDAFTAAKAGVLGLARHYCKERGLIFHWLRFFYVIGPGQRENSLIPYVVRSLKQGQIPALRTAYDENDFVDVRDVAEAVLTVAEKAPTEANVLNVGSGCATSILALTMEIMHAFGLSDELHFPEPTSKVSFYADISKIQELTGWTPRIELSQSIKDYIVNIS